VDLAAAIGDLNGRAPEHMPEPDLERIAALCDLLDHPELAFPSIQVTGTNGKSTIALLTAALACAHGLTTGTFTSPHVVSMTERLSVCGEPIRDEEFAEEYERLRPYLELVDERVGRVTYFEALTGLAFLWFADAPVGLGVLEVGMGGRWDATNVARGDVAVIAPVGLDHVGVLGSTVAEIAAEKAGIIKEGRVAVIREQQDPAAGEVIERRAKEVGATVLWEGPDFRVQPESLARAVGGQAFSVTGAHADYEELFLPLHGDSAAANAAASIVAVEALLGRALDAAAVRRALAAARMPGRMEVAGTTPAVVLDGAHNPEAMREVVDSVGHAFRWSRFHLVMAMSDDKDVEAVTGIAAQLAGQGHPASAYVARNSTSRSATPDRVAAGLLRGGLADVATFDTVAQAVAAARDAAEEDDLILVTGSFYTVADARPLFVDA
jgi:dihydrofolate synthase / folylpolyglutamate synthase